MKPHGEIIRKTIRKYNIPPKTKIVKRVHTSKKDAEYIEAVRMILNKGRQYAQAIYGQRFFFVNKTPKFLKDLGLEGDSFTISYGTISRHILKDTDHKLTEKIWQEVAEAIRKPFAVTKYYLDENHTKQKGYRLYTTISVGMAYVVVGIDVKSIGRNLNINSIATIFAKQDKITRFEELIYKAKKITPQQSALLIKLNP